MLATVKNYAELGRVSNLPTCITNVLVGCAVGAEAASLRPLTVAAVIGGIGLLYVGGMALNDVVDAKIDGKERPKRPIPSGRISRRCRVSAAEIPKRRFISRCSSVRSYSCGGSNFSGLLSTFRMTNS